MASNFTEFIEGDPVMKNSQRVCRRMIVLLAISLLVCQTYTYSQEITLYPDDYLADKGIKSYKDRDYVQAAIYLFAFIQRNSATVKDWPRETVQATYVDALAKALRKPRGMSMKGDGDFDESLGKIILFEHAGFEGRSRIITSHVTYLENFNDKTTSLIVISGEWALYKHANGQAKGHQAIGTVSVYGGPDGDGCYPGTEYWNGRNDEISAVYNIR